MNPRAVHEPSALPVPISPPSREGVVRFRVRYNECDPMGVVHHGSYASWLEIGRTELLRAAGVSYRAMEAAGVFLVIVKLSIRYKRPARYDDEIEVQTKAVRGSRVKIDHEYEVYRVGGDGSRELCVTAETTLACVDGTGHVRELPTWLQGS